MKRIFYLPHLLLIAFAGLFCDLIGWEAADDYLMAKYQEIERRANA